MSSDQFNNSILLFNKPLNWTSYDVVNKVQRLVHLKIGHAGTLDPLATGLLILCSGVTTKKISMFQDLEKEYTGTMVLGATTPSHDLETEIDCRFDISHITPAMIQEVSKTFLGEKLQSPPVFSAKKTEGKRYYEFAREGKSFIVNRNLVTLHSFEIIKTELPEIDFKIVCGKGFYVRSLVHDVGKVLNAGAYLSKLCRTRIGNYYLKDAWQIEDFAKFVRESSN